MVAGGALRGENHVTILVLSNYFSPVFLNGAGRAISSADGGWHLGSNLFRLPRVVGVNHPAVNRRLVGMSDHAAGFVREVLYAACTQRRCALRRKHRSRSAFAPRRWSACNKGQQVNSETALHFHTSVPRFKTSQPSPVRRPPQVLCRTKTRLGRTGQFKMAAASSICPNPYPYRTCRKVCCCTSPRRCSRTQPSLRRCTGNPAASDCRMLPS